MPKLPSEYDSPFHIMLERFWEVFNANEFFQTYIREGNKIKFDNELGLKERISNGDLIEIVLIPQGQTQREIGNSRQFDLIQHYAFYISTGTKNPDWMMACEWQLFRVLETFMANAGACTFNDKQFGINLQIDSTAEGLSNADLNRGIEGWTASWKFNVHLTFDRSDVIYTIQ